MSTIVRRKRTSRRELGPYKRHELLTGHIFYPQAFYSGYGDGVGKDLSQFVSDDMRVDWETNRDELLKFWASGKRATIFADALPWLYEHGEPGTLEAQNMYGTKGGDDTLTAIDSGTGSYALLFGVGGNDTLNGGSSNSYLYGAATISSSAIVTSWTVRPSAGTTPITANRLRGLRLVRFPLWPP
jgi:hypothetical protein